MTYRFKTDLKYSDITPKADFMNRRTLMATAGGLAIAGALGGVGNAATIPTIKSQYSTDETVNTFEDVSSYNNYYEFGTGKEDPAKYAHSLTTDPWSVKVGGLVDKPGNYSFGDIIKDVQMEERIYRFRCVEAWSMVVPWVGFSLSQFLNTIEPHSGARYVSFETLVRPDEMRGQKRGLLNWPYREGLTISEAMHPLTMLVTGVHGQDLPNQNGAPLRLIVPWKYGFKSIKSIVNITLTANRPQSTWNQTNAREYGFFSNVNPSVDHPRWSQASERPIGGGLFARRKKTELFNGYGNEVASLYAGMDLQKNF